MQITKENAVYKFIRSKNNNPIYMGFIFTLFESDRDFLEVCQSHYLRTQKYNSVIVDIGIKRTGMLDKVGFRNRFLIKNFLIKMVSWQREQYKLYLSSKEINHFYPSQYKEMARNVINQIVREFIDWVVITDTVDILFNA